MILYTVISVCRGTTKDTLNQPSTGNLANNSAVSQCSMDGARDFSRQHAYNHITETTAPNNTGGIRPLDIHYQN